MPPLQGAITTMLAGATMFICWFYFFVKMAILICITIMCPKSCMEKLFVVAGLTLSVGYQQLNCAIAQVLLPVLFGFLHVPTVAGRTMSCKCKFKRGYNKYPHIHRISPYTQHSLGDGFSGPENNCGCSARVTYVTP